MKILGKEYGLRYTVGAQEEILALCPEKDITRLAEALYGESGEEKEVNRKAAQLPIILSDWHERTESLRAKAEGRAYMPAPLDWETIQFLTVEEFSSLMEEAFLAMSRDSGREVKTDNAVDEKKTDAAADTSLS